MATLEEKAKELWLTYLQAYGDILGDEDDQWQDSERRTAWVEVVRKAQEQQNREKPQMTPVTRRVRTAWIEQIIQALPNLKNEELSLIVDFIDESEFYRR